MLTRFTPLMKQGLLLLLTGLGGLVASFQLTVDKIRLLENPNADLSCNINGVVQCGTNLDSWQGSVFGFPNSIIGLVAFAVFITVGVLLVSNVQIPSWVMIGVNTGAFISFIWVLWFIYQSIFVLGTLCIWCMLMWVSVIIMFWGNLAVSLQQQQMSMNVIAQKIGEVIKSWVWVIIVLHFILIATVFWFRATL